MLSSRDDNKVEGADDGKDVFVQLESPIEGLPFAPLDEGVPHAEDEGEAERRKDLQRQHRHLVKEGALRGGDGRPDDLVGCLAHLQDNIGGCQTRILDHQRHVHHVKGYQDGEDCPHQQCQLAHNDLSILYTGRTREKGRVSKREKGKGKSYRASSAPEETLHGEAEGCHYQE